MEEQKNKEVKMEVAQDNNNATKDQKYTYEQLNDICNRLFQENQQLKLQIQQANKFIQTLNRLDYLFKVVEIQNASRTGLTFKDDFYYACVHEIEEIMAVPEEDNKETSEEN